MTFLSQGGRGREPNLVDRLVLGATAPLQRWMVAGGEGVVEGVKSYVDLRGVREQNLTLEDEARRLRGELNGLIELRAENQRLKSALGYVEASSGVQVLARVVGFGPAASPPTVRLDRGSDAGIRTGMPVLTVDGVVGVVVRTTAGSADVSLISDPQTRVGVRVQRSRARATVAGAGAVRPLRLENALRADDLEDGDVLVTSGADGIFPGGLVVGHVRRLSKTNLGVFQEAEVHPAVELGRIEEVLVVTSPVERTLEAVLPSLEPDPLSPSGAVGGVP